MAGKAPTLTELAERVLAAAKSIDGYLDNNNVPKPSFAIESPLGLPFVPEVQGAKVELQEALADLSALVAGPTEILSLEITQNIHDMNVINVANKFNFWEAVPLKGSATYKQISEKTGLNEEAVKRILRHAMTKRLFAETSPGSGEIVHTALSSAAVKDKRVSSWLIHTLDEVWPGSAKVADALKKWNNVEDADKTGGAIAHFGDDPKIKSLFDWYHSPGNEWREANFGASMAYVSQNPALNVKAINRMYDWNALGDFTFVDVGGSVGHITYELASKTPKMKAIVEDLPGLEEPFKQAVPEDLKSRVEFKPYDFFTPQPVKGADIYFFKHILHDWSDPIAAKILNQTVPAMKDNPKSRIMLCEFVIPPEGAVPRPVTRLGSMMDLQMLSLANAKERSAEDWIHLLKLADEKLELKKIHSVPDCGFALVEIGYNA